MNEYWALENRRWRAARYPPSGCCYCGVAERGHAQQWSRAKGWHKWTRPTDSQIKTRMYKRRNATNGKPWSAG